MPPKLPWTQRRFSFDFPTAIYPDILERLRGTPARAEDLVRGLDHATLIARTPGADGAPAWSIQENVGHLVDLEALDHLRIDDFLAGAAVLHTWDINNRATHEAGHNARRIADLLQDLRRERGALVARLEALVDSDFDRVSRHPRLNVPMRLVDWMYFVAAHDDYHLASVTRLARLLARSAAS